MIISAIKCRRFAKYASVDVSLPPRGLVVVTGKNGHGKSSLAEAVAQGVWDKPIRGTPGWRMGEKSGVRIDFEGGHVNRAVSSGKQSLQWLVGEDGAASYPTRTKSQDAFESHVGTFHVWRHACVFHTKDASVFTEATDSERKRLLEDVLELSRVEKAYRKARDESTDAKRELVAANHDHALAVNTLHGREGQRTTLSGELEQAPDIDAMRAAGRELKCVLDEYTLAVKHTQATLREYESKINVLRSTARTLQARVLKFESLAGECNQCEQAIDGEHRDRQHASALLELDTLNTEIARLEIELSVAVAENSRAEDQYTTQRYAYDANVSEGRDAVALHNRNLERAAKLETIDAEVANAALAVSKAQAVVDAAVVHAATLDAAAEALSYQGARAAILSAAVTGLQDLANTWLARLGLHDLQVELSSQSETKTGKVSDKISFDLKGAGGGYGYRAASTGEQRRIDIAMLFALGELAADSRGLSKASTMFVDELFDGLDEDGTAAVVTMLKELATERCVVVITHSERLVSELAPDLHLVAQNGLVAGK